MQSSSGLPPDHFCIIIFSKKSVDKKITLKIDGPDQVSSLKEYFWSGPSILRVIFLSTLFLEKSNNNKDGLDTQKKN